MRLKLLTSDRASFRPLKFNESGVSLILGTGSTVGNEGSSNGVGKTLALRLVHHCLGGKIERGVRTMVGDWHFILRFEVDEKEHQIERSGDGSYLTLDEQSVGATGLRDWLNEAGAFLASDGYGHLFSFRSLFKHFARTTQRDSLEPQGVGDERPYEKLVRSLFLLGLDTSLALNKHESKQKIEDIKRALRVWQANPELTSLFRTGNDARARASYLRDTLPEIASHMERMVISEDYYRISRAADEMTSELRVLEEREEVLNFQVARVEESLAERPDISREEMLHLYQGLEQLFRPEALRHFEAVEEFHNSLLANRRRRLGSELTKLKSGLGQVQTKRKDVGERRDTLLASLTGKTTMDEYRRVADEFAQRQRELGSLEKFLDAEAEAHRQVRELTALMVDGARQADEYLASNPTAEFDSRFRALTRRLYPELASGITLTTNLGDNQVRFDLNVTLEGSHSDGINMARIICYDWLVLTMGANHRMDMLWHDNRIFSHMDPVPRTEWFKFAARESLAFGKQYIASLNSENFESMIPHLTAAEQVQMREAVVLNLRGDSPEQKLLGIQADI